MNAKHPLRPSGPPLPQRPQFSKAPPHRAKRPKRKNPLVPILQVLVLVGLAGFAYQIVSAPPAPIKASDSHQATSAAIPAPIAETPRTEITPPTPPVSAPQPEITPPPVSATAQVEPAPEPPPGIAEPRAAEPIAAEPPLLLVGLESQRDAAIERDEALLVRACNRKEWDGYRALLAKSITAGLLKLTPGRGVNRFDSVWSEKGIYQALLRWKTLGCFSESEITALVTDSYTGSMFLWLLHHNEAMEELLLTIDPKDDAGKVLKALMDVWPVNKDKYQKYFPLALACAVVFDHPVTIPHSVGKAEYGVESSVNPLKRYFWFVEKNEAGKLAAPVHHSSARDLVWVVCAPITTSEMEWSLDKMQLRRANWGSAYGMIRYLMERAVKGINPYKEYSFAEIRKEGGICGDQSYFCVNTARAQGIPAMTIAGETNLGGHAWAALKIDANEWTTGVGRVAGASNGQADNPQTAASLSEQEILLWNDRLHQSAVVTLAVHRHLWLADFFAASNNAPDNAATIHLANSKGRSFVETWQAWFHLLVSQTKIAGSPPAPNNLAEWKTFAKDMRREFKNNPRMTDLAAKAEAEYIFPYGAAGDAQRALSSERRRIERYSGEQADLIASSLKREAEVIVKLGAPDAKQAISRLYDRALRDYGGSITGFKMMAEDYFSYFKDDKELAHKAARDIELAFKRVVETGSTDFFRSQTEASICQMICGYYRTAGEPERATQLEKRYEVLLRRAKRGAL